MNSTAHDNCEKWIISKFKSYGLEVKTQKADLKGIDGEVFHSTNIIASYNPKAATRILVSATGTAVRGPTTTPTAPSTTSR